MATSKLNGEIMKKVLLFLLSICCLMLPNCISSFAYASSLEQSAYLIAPSYSQNAEFHGISDEEINNFSRPVNEKEKKIMTGQSVSPKTDEKNQFEKTFATNAVSISSNQSLYIYLFFSESSYLHDLKIVVSDGDASLTWQISSEELQSQVMQSSITSRLRFGWILLELPISSASQSGNLQNVSNISIGYNSQDCNQSSYAKLMFYAPYVDESKNTDIAFIEKQNYYNFSINWGDNIDKYCVGDRYAVSSWNDMFDYCMLGDVDFLTTQSNLYRFVFEIIDQNGTTQRTNMFSNEFVAQFDIAGTYIFRVTLYDSDGNWLWKNPDKQVEVEEFVALYLNDGLKNLNINKEYSFDINIGQLVEQYANINVESSNQDVAEAYISDGKLIVKTKKSGNAQIKLNVYASRANADEDLYSYTYELSVVDNNESFSWITIIIGSILLIIIAILVYIIMVKRRAIPGKYPKY